MLILTCLSIYNGTVIMQECVASTVSYYAIKCLTCYTYANSHKMDSSPTINHAN